MSLPRPTSKWIEFRQHPPLNRTQRTKRWGVYVRPEAETGASAFGSDFAVAEWLGDVRWYSPWRRYIFNPAAACIFEGDCLRDLAAFIEEQTRLRREARARERSQE